MATKQRAARARGATKKQARGATTKARGAVKKQGRGAVKEQGRGAVKEQARGGVKKQARGATTKARAATKQEAKATPSAGFVDAQGARYLAAKMAQHAGARFPALDAGEAGTHFYEVVGDTARQLAALVDETFDADDQILIVVLRTDKKRSAELLAVDRYGLGGEKIGVVWSAKGTLGASAADVLAGARELPVPGRITGFTLSPPSKRAVRRKTDN